jgi:hypothetical protein
MPSKVLGLYVHSAPKDQNALDIFKGEWTSRLPACSYYAGPIV